jgi:hypothetical protein
MAGRGDGLEECQPVTLMPSARKYMPTGPRSQRTLRLRQGIRARVGRLRSALAERRRSAGHFLGVWVVDVGLRRLCWRLENGRALDIWLRQRPNWYRVPACVYVTAPRDSND